MKRSSHSLVRRWRTLTRGFTLVEMVVATTVFTLVILATVALQIYALRVYTLASTKMIATADARMTMNDIRDRVREAREVYVGNYSALGNYPSVDFSAVTNGGMQEGNALLIYPTTATNAFALIYLQSANGTTTNLSTMDSRGNVINTNSLVLLVYTNSTLSVSNIIAGYITNEVVFDAENFEGAILSSNQNNYLVHLTLDFSQYEYPIALIGTNKFNAYDYYQLNTVMTRRDTD
jgi:prepilin-type N-terminal cleavage/methylation domain-containing protein